MAKLILFHPLEMRFEQQDDKLVVSFTQLIEKRPYSGTQDKALQVIDRREQSLAEQKARKNG